MTKHNQIVSVAFGMLLLGSFTSFAESADVVRKIVAEVPYSPENHKDIEKHLKNMESKDTLVLRQAISGLAYWQREDISTLLKDRLRRNLKDGKGWTRSFYCTGGERRIYLYFGPENLSITSALVRQGRMEALPMLKQAQKYLMGEPVKKRSSEATKNIANHIYSLSAESVSCWDGKEEVRYEPSPDQEEQTRMLLRPDLQPVRGLIATLQVPVTYVLDDKPANLGIVGSKPVEISLKLSNRTKQPISVDLSPASITFSVVTRGKRRDVSAAKLSKPTRNSASNAIPAGRSITLTWSSEEIKRLAFHDVTNADFMIKAVYSPATEPLRSEWGKDRLQSDTLWNSYFANE